MCYFFSYRCFDRNLTAIYKIYIINQISLIENFINSLPVEISLILIEPKASGKSLKQMISSQTSYNVTEIKTPFVSNSKIENVRASSNYIEGCRVKLIKGNWNNAFLNQVGTFPNAKHDEHIDLTCYGVERHLINNFKIDIR